MDSMCQLRSGLPTNQRGSAITIGTFDGVHLGHLAVLEELHRQAENQGLCSVLVTFFPHPLRIVQPEFAPPILTTADEKKDLLAETELSYAVFLPFTSRLARYSPDRFVKEILVEQLDMRHLVIGYDHGFGRGRSGGVDTLRRVGSNLGFQVHVVPAVMLDGNPVSSTRIRRTLLAGDVVGAAEALGRPYSIQGAIVKGEGRGRDLGFPTANVQVTDPDKLFPKPGVYAVRAAFRNPRFLEHRLGVLHLGPRPTFQGSPPSIELHLFEFEGDLYGEPVQVEFCARLRDIRPFSSAEQLIHAIKSDCDEARRCFANNATACKFPDVDLD